MPGATDEAAATVRDVDVVPLVIAAGENEAVIPEGTLSVVRSTVPLNDPVRAMLAETEVLLPCTTLSVDDDSVIAKPPTAGGLVVPPSPPPPQAINRRAPRESDRRRMGRARTDMVGSARRESLGSGGEREGWSRVRIVGSSRSLQSVRRVGWSFGARCGERGDSEECVG